MSSCSPRAVLQERASGLRCGPCKVKAHANEIRKIDTRVLGRAPALPIIQQPGKFQATSWNQTHILLQNIRIPVNEIKGSSELMYLRAGRMVKYCDIDHKYSGIFLTFIEVRLTRKSCICLIDTMPIQFGDEYTNSGIFPKESFRITSNPHCKLG